MMQTGGQVPETEIKERIKALRTHLERQGMDGAFILQKTDLFYFSGTAQDAVLYVPVDQAPLLMVRKDINRAKAETSIGRILPLKSPGQLPGYLKEFGIKSPASLGMELDVVPAGIYLDYQHLFPGAEIADISHAIRLIRSVKSSFEISIIEEAARRADRIFEWIPPLLHEGVPEIELAGQVEALFRKLGHQGIVRMRMWGADLFYGHLMAGPSAAIPSFLASPTGGAGTSPNVAQSAGFRPLRKHEPILVDYVFAHSGYIADQTRIFAMGDLDDDFVKAHEAMLTVQKTLQKAARPGTVSGDLYQLAVDCAEALGQGDFFMGEASRRIRFVGHGVGTELDEYPFIAARQTLPLKENMVIALEPKVIFPDKGVVGIENTHLLTKEGLRPLTRYKEEITFV